MHAPHTTPIILDDDPFQQDDFPLCRVARIRERRPDLHLDADTVVYATALIKQSPGPAASAIICVGDGGSHTWTEYFRRVDELWLKAHMLTMAFSLADGMLGSLSIYTPK